MFNTTKFSETLLQLRSSGWLEGWKNIATAASHSFWDDGKRAIYATSMTRLTVNDHSLEFRLEMLRNCSESCKPKTTKRMGMMKDKELG